MCEVLDELPYVVTEAEELLRFCLVGWFRPGLYFGCLAGVRLYALATDDVT